MSSPSPLDLPFAALSRASASLEDATRALRRGARVDLDGLPLGGAAMWLERYQASQSRRVVLITDTWEAARQLADDLLFFSKGEGPDASPPLLFPPLDTTPYLDVASDRRAAMDRAAVLFHLGQGLPWRFVVTSATAISRRVPPREALLRRSQWVRAEDELDREAFLAKLSEGGYLRVPVAEDPGTFALRGSIIDVFSPHAPYPVRIELDDWLVLSIKFFDPEDQRTVEETREVFIHPVRDVLLGESERALATQRIRELCDAIDMPTTKARALIDELDEGRAGAKLEGYLPAFYPRLESFFDYLGEEVDLAIVGVGESLKELREELARAQADFEAKVEQKVPAFALHEHYLDEGEVVSAWTQRPHALVHRLAQIASETQSADAPPGAALEGVHAETLLRIGAEDQSSLRAALRTQRASDPKADGLAPLAERAKRWLDEGYRVVFTTRTQTQSDRLATLLKGHGLSAQKGASGSLKSAGAQSGLEIRVGSLSHGFVFPSERLVFVTEEEVFGSRTRRAAKTRTMRQKAQAFLEDLRELKVGDYVVHIDHGVGRYLGLERQSLGQSQFERFRGEAQHAVEVLVVEYQGGKLLLPVTRLNQIQKYAGREGQAPKLDRLGGQTFAKTKARVQKAVQQLADELLRLYAERAASAREPLPPADRAYAEFEATFPFEETPDQSRAIDEVMHDLEAAHPMDRLVCGDVGFGKTEVAIRAAFRVAMAGRQVAMLCPTTVLAQQHFLNFQERLREYPLRVEVLSRFVDRKRQQEIIAQLREGKVDILIGTHRLLSKDIHFQKLGLLIVDEEQRFGVVHKERIKQLRTSVDVLTLSATPIPRTLHMTVGGLRDLSLITTPPVDRRAVRTFICTWDDHLLREAIQRELARGGQVFFVHNRIEGLYEYGNQLQRLVPNARIAVAHGQMKEGLLEQMMTDFVEGRYDVLCSTAIIESGLDIPRANTMIVSRADTFGLAQLYQLRGRVGRSRERAYCYLVAPPPAKLSDESRYRLEALERFTELGSGFHIATLDMELRGAGDLLGNEQSGTVQSVGLELFAQMLEEAIADLRGESIVRDIDPEIHLDLPYYIPEGYVDEVGLRLSFYKRFASAEDESGVMDLAREMEDRFGEAPEEARTFVRAMRIKPELRHLRVLGCEASKQRVTLQLKEDTPLDPRLVMALVAKDPGRWKLTPDVKLTRRFDQDESGDAIDHIESMLRALDGCLKSGQA